MGNFQTLYHEISEENDGCNQLVRIAYTLASGASRLSWRIAIRIRVNRGLGAVFG
jgi:hypothetical protein